MINNNKPYIIAETAYHHEGDKDFLVALVKEICKTEVDAIKFHLLFDLSDYMVNNHPAVEVLQNISIGRDDWNDILLQVESEKKDIVLLCNDKESLRWVNSRQHELDIKAIEIHASGLNDIFLLDEATHFRNTIILGTGGSTFDEIKFAVDFLKKAKKNDILLMHGFQNYPTDFKEINFKRMAFLNQTFDLPVGYADHTDPNDEKNPLISVLPQVMGFNILEKHVTSCFGEKRVDAQAAVSIETIKNIIALSHDVFSSRGTDFMEFSESELAYGNTGPLKKAIVARQNIRTGEEMTLDNVAFKRTEMPSPLRQKDLSKILGSRASVDIPTDEVISYSNVEYQFRKEDFSQFFINKKQ